MSYNYYELIIEGVVKKVNENKLEEVNKYIEDLYNSNKMKYFIKFITCETTIDYEAEEYLQKYDPYSIVKILLKLKEAIEEGEVFFKFIGSEGSEWGFIIEDGELYNAEIIWAKADKIKDINDFI